MYLVARTLHGVRCSQCVYRWLVSSKLHVWWSVSRVVRSDEGEGGGKGLSPCQGDCRYLDAPGGNKGWS
jgi:hypothetical protein